MKILSITGSVVNKNRGTPIRVMSIINALAKYSTSGITVCSEDDKMEHQKLNHFKIPSGVFPKIKFFLKNNFFNSEGFDLVIFHTSGNSLLVFFFKLFSKSKIMIEMHGFIKDEIFLQEKVYSPIRYIKIYFHELLAILSFICADYITTCSYSAKIRLLKFNKNVHVLWGGAEVQQNVSRLPQKVEDFVNEARNKGRLIIGYSGNSRPWQGLNELLNFYKKFQHELQLSLVLILSEKTVITNLEGLENFILLNNLSKTDADSVISNVDVLAITRPDNKVVRFSFASKILTYIALGKPIFSSAVGDINFHVLNYINGMTYQPGNENDMKDKMNALRDCDLRKRIFENNLIYAKKTLTWEKQIKELFVFLNSDK